MYLLAGVQGGLQQRRQLLARGRKRPQLGGVRIRPVQPVEAPQQQHEGVAGGAADDVLPQFPSVSRRLVK